MYSNESFDKISIVSGDITKINTVQAIVNAANTSLLGGGGVDGAIHRAAGKGLVMECSKLNGCKTGDAKITGAYNLPCDYVIHTVGPVWNDGNYDEPKKLASCYRRSLEVAAENSVKTIAFPGISIGVYRYPIHEATKIALNTVLGFLENNPNTIDKVVFVLIDDYIFDEYNSVFNSIKENN